MDKLVYWTSSGESGSIAVTDRLSVEECMKIQEPLKLLAAYQATGLTPEEIKHLNSFDGSQAIKLLKKLHEEQEKHRWIPVEERLPDEKAGMVLIQVNGKPAKNITLHDAFEFGEYSKVEGWILEEYPDWVAAAVVAWQPLPEPYRTEEEQQ